MPKRIIPVASGKGGVGKTTFAVHFALELSKRAPTVLVDLDTATSSLRNTLRMPVAHDLYHFHRKGHRLSDCVTQLDAHLDRSGRFKDFGFVAGPIHYLEDLAAMGPELRRRLAGEIAALPADYVVLDLRAGVDATVLEFLPYTNSGVLVFTPQLPQAAAAAADLVKAVVFRTLRIVFGAHSGVFELPGISAGRELIDDLLGRAEDAYDSSVPSLDYLLRDLRDVFGEHPLVAALGELLSEFRVHYLLNQFDGVEASHEGAVVPFVRTLSDGVSARLELTQLGWLAQDASLHRANCLGRPILLEEESPRTRAVAGEPYLAELEALRHAALGLERRPSERIARQRKLAAAADPVDALLGEQLDHLRAIFAGSGGGGGVRENLAYCVSRALALMQPPRLPTEFGMTQLAPPEQLVRWLLRRMPVAAAAASGAGDPVR
ncbi:MAG: MinD/ParA family protein [Thermoanaerobaculia bacterium]|nr:MAG: MinD/ParA family protein [Thermoanaerobaculia bacterium]